MTVDGTVDSDGVAKVWVVSDSNYHRGAGVDLCFSDCSVPSRLYGERPDLIAKLERAYLEVCSRLAARGFRSSWVDVEFFVEEEGEGDVKLMEVNGRMFVQMTDVYRRVRGVFQIRPLATRTILPKHNSTSLC